MTDILGMLEGGHLNLQTQVIQIHSNQEELLKKLNCKGKEPLCIVSGKQTNFLVSPPIGPGTKLTIRVKANKKGHEFGVILASDYYPNIASAPKLDGGGGRTSYLDSKSFSTKMFDAIIVDVERFNIWGSYGDYNAAAVKYDQTEKILNNTRIKQYEEERRFSKRDLIDIVRRLLGF